NSARTEWLQILILQVKARLKTEPDYLQTNSVIGFDFGPKPEPRWPTVPDRRAWVARVTLAMFHQLPERLALFALPDPLAADLISHFENLLALTASPADARDAMAPALKYGPHKKALAEQRLQHFKQIAPSISFYNMARSGPLFWLVLPFICVSIVIFVFQK